MAITCCLLSAYPVSQCVGSEENHFHHRESGVRKMIEAGSIFLLHLSFQHGGASRFCLHGRLCLFTNGDNMPAGHEPCLKNRRSEMPDHDRQSNEITLQKTYQMRVQGKMGKTTHGPMCLLACQCYAQTVGSYSCVIGKKFVKPA